jgi:hypothetical protein
MAKFQPVRPIPPIIDPAETPPRATYNAGDPQAQLAAARHQLVSCQEELEQADFEALDAFQVGDTQGQVAWKNVANVTRERIARLVAQIAELETRTTGEKKHDPTT